MTIKCRCPKCNKSYSLNEKLAGKKAKCKCGKIMRIPNTANKTTNDESVYHKPSGRRKNDQKWKTLFNSDSYLLRRSTRRGRSLSSGLGLHVEVLDAKTKECIAIVHESKGILSGANKEKR